MTQLGKNESMAATVAGKPSPFHATQNTGVPTGRIACLTVAGPNPIEYYIYRPENCGDGTRLLVSIHGISRNALEQVRYFAKLAEVHNTIVVAPHFKSPMYQGYQTLGVDDGQQRSDKALHAILADLKHRGLWNGHPFSMFGFSGGAQFTHRYAMAYPTHLNSIAIGAAGWYTLPDETSPFPIGIAPTNEHDLTFDLDAFLDVPCHVIVGQKDTKRDHALNKSPELDKAQGKTRLDRGRVFIEKMMNASRQRQKTPQATLNIVDRAGHSFSKGMSQYGLGKLVFEKLFLIK